MSNHITIQQQFHHIHELQQGLVEKAGAWYSYQTDRIGQGKKNASDFLDDHPEIRDELESKIRAELLGESDPDAAAEDNVTPITGI